MKNIHTLPTEKSSRLYSISKTLILSPLSTKHENNIGRHIYITSDDKFVKDEYITDGIEVIKSTPKLVDAQGLVNRRDWKKIILTTDQDLIKDGVQAITDEFIEWFVKNPKSENVYVYKKYKQVNQNNPVTRGSTALGFSHYEVQSLDLSAPIGTSEKEIDILELGQIIPKEEYKKQTIEGILETLDTKQLGELNIFLKGMERKETQNKELYDDLVDLLERLRPIYKEVTDLHWKYEQKRLDLIELLKKK